MGTRGCGARHLAACGARHEQGVVAAAAAQRLTAVRSRARAVTEATGRAVTVGRRVRLAKVRRRLKVDQAVSDGGARPTPTTTG